MISSKKNRPLAQPLIEEGVGNSFTEDENKREKKAEIGVVV